jgi:glycosyltransferase involved in cell wall biosynthesis
MKKVINKKQPTVSVIMPVYNAQDFLVESLDSIFDQTYKDFELIIVDDASTDNSWRIIQEYKKKHPKKIIARRLKKNLNCGGDRCANEALRLATGKYIARMDADDIAIKNRLEKQVAYLESHPRTFLVGSNAYVIDKEGTLLGEKLEPESTKAIYHAYFGFHPLIHPTCMFRRVVKGNPFQYEIVYSANNDYYTFFKLLCNGAHFVNLPEKLLYYRVHGKNATFVNVKQKFLNATAIRYVMVTKYHYKPTVKDLLTLATQALVVFTFPEYVLMNLYFLAKGIKKPTISFSLPHLRLGAKPAVRI